MSGDASSCLREIRRPRGIDDPIGVFVAKPLVFFPGLDECFQARHTALPVRMSDGGFVEFRSRDDEFREREVMSALIHRARRRLFQYFSQLIRFLFQIGK